jgi:hypothetical protein
VGNCGSWFALRVSRGRIVQIDIIADSARIRRLDVAVPAG